MPESVPCNLCGADEPRRLFELRDYRLRVDDVLWTVVSCGRCGLGYLNPRPTRTETARYYPASYFDHRAVAHARYERMAGYLPKPPGELLDVGTARGDFLVLARERGWSVTGIEGHAEPRPDVPVLRESFPEECSLPGGRFDVITAWAVFEHLHDPRKAFFECARMLKPGGRLIVQVPNRRSIWFLARQEDVPRHLYFYDPRTLNRFGDATGLRLDTVHHTTDLFGGSGRGVLRLWYSRLLGRSLDEFFEIWATPRRARWRRWPLFTGGWSAAAAVESVLLPDRLVRTLRLSGQVVAVFSKPLR